MALFRALQGIAPHLDAAMVLNVCEGAGLIVTIRDDSGQLQHYGDEIVATLGCADGDAAANEAVRYFDERGRLIPLEEQPHERVRRSGEDVLNAVFRVEGPARSVWVQMSFTALAPGEGGYSVLGIGTDITVRREAEQVLQRMATHDGLTGLLNRVGLLARAEPTFDAAAASGEPFAVALLDIDHFKLVNDTHGHAAGDAVLSVVAATIRETLPSGAHIGRWGGEEFLAVFPGATRETAIALAEALRNATAAAVVSLDGIDGAAHAGGGIVHVTASLGVAVEPAAGESIDDFIRRADTALYAAKRNGRDRVAA
ncbi:MAG: GGDEF domain-containing protein [Chloroflexi bacterium]|nr:GGDEF domain-containing protein [Chloroflexota bacterium]MDA1145784.1 GGDEF domain-containing protein [Chloroflexota bacterium]